LFLLAVFSPVVRYAASTKRYMNTYWMKLAVNMCLYIFPQLSSCRVDASPGVDHCIVQTCPKTYVPVCGSHFDLKCNIYSPTCRVTPSTPLVTKTYDNICIFNCNKRVCMSASRGSAAIASFDFLMHCLLFINLQGYPEMKYKLVSKSAC
jgi:hypothetical protein